jgi:hypothetical protein
MAGRPVGDLPVVRLEGTVLLNDDPMPLARLRAFDMRTGEQIPLTPFGRLAFASLEEPAAADEAGKFDYMLPPLAPTQLVKITATRDDRTISTVVDGSGRTIEAARSSYRLRQAGLRVTVSISLRITAATTLAGKAYEGSLKMQYQLPDPGVAPGLTRVWEALLASLQALQAELEAKPALALTLAQGMTPQGELADPAALAPTLATLAPVQALQERLADLMQAFAGDMAGSDGSTPTGLDPVTGEDFPLGGITISTEGSFTFQDADGQPITGSFEPGAYKPIGEAPTGPEAPPAPAEPGGGSNEPGDAEVKPIGTGVTIHDGPVLAPTASEALEVG